jgi:Putative peptidoglycan binding domain
MPPRHRSVAAPERPGDLGGGRLYVRRDDHPTGRTAGVVALRDGLCAACQAYANGALGQDAYSVILSQYGTLLVRLVSASSTSDPGGPPAAPSRSSTPTAGAPSSMLVNVVTPGTGAAAQPSAGTLKACDLQSASPADDPMSQARAQAVGALIVACITEPDSTRLRGPTQNTVLTAAWSTMINNLAKEAPSLLQNLSPSMKPDGEAAIAAVDPMVAAYQGVLQIEGFYKGKIDGRLWGETKKALSDYQKVHHLDVTGQADKSTLTEMKL